jgi:UDP-glucuronate 4-epimerase
METILVTGGAGFIGSHVCDELLVKSKKVICIDNFNDYYNPKIKEKNIEFASKNNNFILYKINITNKEKLKDIFEKNQIDKIIHLAARVGVRASFKDWELYEGVNIEGTKNLLELANEFNIKNFIFGSSSSVYGTNKKIPFFEDNIIENIISPYAETKKKAEELCREYHDKHGLSVTCLRFFTVYGPRGRPDMASYKFIKKIISNEQIEMYGDGTTKRDYIYVTDIIDGILLALEKTFSFEIINLGNSNPIELKRFISIIEKETGEKAEIKQLLVQKGDVLITYADISKARRLLDYSPKIKIEQGIKMFIEWFKTNKIII